MLPVTSPVLGFRFNGSTQYLADKAHDLPFAVVSGMRKSILSMKDHANTANLIVVFKPGGASAFFRESLHEVAQDIVSLEDFSHYERMDQFEEELTLAKTNLERIRLVEQLLLSKLQMQKDRAIQEAMRIIHVNKGVVRIKELASQLFMSLDVFEKRFRKVTGATPKHFCYIVRMTHAIQAVSHSRLVDLSLDLGYYDQAHFSKDFKHFTGITPLEFIRNPIPEDQ